MGVCGLMLFNLSGLMANMFLEHLGSVRVTLV